MRKLALIAFMLLMFSAGGLVGAQVALTPEQEARANQLEYQIMAACCWNGTIADHASSTADKQRAQLREFVAQDLSDREILDRFTEMYTTKVLSAPPARGFSLLLYIIPILGVAGAVYFYGVKIRELVVSSFATGPQPGTSPATAPGSVGGDDSYRSRLMEELDEFEDRS